MKNAIARLKGEHRRMADLSQRLAKREDDRQALHKRWQALESEAAMSGVQMIAGEAEKVAGMRRLAEAAVGKVREEIAAQEAAIAQAERLVRAAVQDHIDEQVGDLLPIYQAQVQQLQDTYARLVELGHKPAAFKPPKADRLAALREISERTGIAVRTLVPRPEALAPPPRRPPVRATEEPVELAPGSLGSDTTATHGVGR